VAGLIDNRCGSGSGYGDGCGSTSGYGDGSGYGYGGDYVYNHSNK